MLKFNHLNYEHVKCMYRELFLNCNIIYHVLNLYLCICVYMFNLYMILVHASTVAAILCELPTPSNAKTIGGMCYAKNRYDRVNTPSWYK